VGVVRVRSLWKRHHSKMREAATGVKKLEPRNRDLEIALRAKKRWHENFETSAAQYLE
jgi:hypothetical protein